MRFVWIGVGLAAMLAVSQPGQAQQGRGDNEVQAQGTVWLATSSSQDSSGSVDVKLGRFFTDRQQAGLEVLGFIAGKHSVFGYGGPFYRYNFSTGKAVPYVGVSAAALFGSSGNGKGARVAGEVGVRYFLDRRTAFTVAASTGYSFDESSFDKRLSVLFGFSHLWGK
jgi:hypothetical protein